MPAKPTATSSMGSRETTATPFHWLNPWWATSKPASWKGSAGNWSSRHLVSWIASTSVPDRSRKASTRSSRARMELTFQVAIRMASRLTPARGAPGGRGAGPRAGPRYPAPVTSPNDSPRSRLAAYVRELAVIHGEVTLASGRVSDHYVDMRRVTLHHAAAPLVGHAMLDLLEEAGLGAGAIDAVGGLTMGADAAAAAILPAAASRGLGVDAGAAAACRMAAATGSAPMEAAACRMAAAASRGLDVDAVVVQPPGG